MKIQILSILGLLFLAGAGQAQVTITCGPSDHVDACLDSLLLDAQSPSGSMAKQAVNNAAAAVADKQTATSITGVEGALRNFLPQILGGLGFQGINQTATNLSFEKPIHWLDNRMIGISLSGVITQPELFKDALAKIPEAIRKDRKATLEGQLGDFDQTDLKIAFDYEKKGEGRSLRWGREAADYSDITDAYAEAVIAVNPHRYGWRHGKGHPRNRGQNPAETAGSESTLGELYTRWSCRRRSRSGKPSQPSFPQHWSRSARNTAISTNTSV